MVDSISWVAIPFPCGFFQVGDFDILFSPNCYLRVAKRGVTMSNYLLRSLALFVVILVGCESPAPKPLTETEAVELFGGDETASLDSLDEVVDSYNPPANSPLFAGIPRTRGDVDVTVLRSPGLIVGYSEAKQCPLWVSYRLFAVGDKEGLGRISRFKTDNRTTAKVTHDHYTGTGYDRGHMAPSSGIAKRYDEAGWKATYKMTNICPQLPTLNQETWEAFERSVSGYYAERMGEVWVTVGPIFDGPCKKLDSTKVGRTDVQVPSHYYKIVVAKIDSRVEVLAVVMGQGTTGRHRISAFVKTVRHIEQKTGLNFLWRLPNNIEDAVEQDDTPHDDWEIGWELRPNFDGRPRTIRTYNCPNN